MQLGRHTLSIIIFSLIAPIFLLSGNVYGRSLYAITECQGGILTAYDIQGEQIEYQIDTDIGSGAIGLALDPDSSILLVKLGTATIFR